MNVGNVSKTYSNGAVFLHVFAACCIASKNINHHDNDIGLRVA